jgi:hypothetical protein
MQDNNTNNRLAVLVQRCRDEDDIDKRIELLYRINSSLPTPQKLKLPSLLTHDYIGVALDRIEERIEIESANLAHM